MKVFELPIPAPTFIEMIRQAAGIAYASPFSTVEFVVQHYDMNCDRIMNYNAIAPESNSFMMELMHNSIIIRMCRCNQEVDLEAKWSYIFE